MYKSAATGFYEHDFRFDWLPKGRYHVSYGVRKKTDAERLHAAAVALFKSKELAVIEAARAGRVTWEQLAQLRESGRPFADALKVVRPADQWPRFVDAIDQYLEAIDNNQNKSAGTHRTASTELARCKRYVEERYGIEAPIRLDEITSSFVDEYQRTLIAGGAKPNTVSNYVSRVGSVFHWFIRRESRLSREQGRLPRTLHVPLDPETISRQRTSRLRFLSDAEAERILAATPEPLLFPVVAGLLGGFRVDEMCHFRTAHDVDLEVGVLSVQRQPTWSPKTKRSVRHVPIADTLRPIVERHLEQHASDDWMMPSFRDPTRPLNSRVFAKHFAWIVADADLITGNLHPEGVSYHTLRHTFASWSLMAGTDVFTVAKLLGNTVKQVDETYGHLALDFRKAAVDRLGSSIKLPTFTDETNAETRSDEEGG